MITSRRARLGPLALASCALSACASHVDAPTLHQSYAAQIDGHRAALAIVVDDTRVVAYLCDENSIGLQESRWFEGPRGSDLALTSTDGARRLLIRLAPDQANITLSGLTPSPIAQTLPIASPGSLVGVYRDPTSACRSGVVVYEDSDHAVQTQGIGCDALGRRSQVTPIRPLDFFSQSLAVRYQRTPAQLRYVVPALALAPSTM
ncbi:MAG: hypothetical protein Q8Q09_01730 [Deltaproteobacteria bacterium]|nr:hypothetical protein [Deltaproteobacteria bacterium]